MSYAEAAYFDGNHCQHVATRDEHLRLQRIAARNRAVIERRRSPRGFRPLIDGMTHCN